MFSEIRCLSLNLMLKKKMAKKLDPSVALGSSNNESEVSTTTTVTTTTATKENRSVKG